MVQCRRGGGDQEGRHACNLSGNSLRNAESTGVKYNPPTAKMTHTATSHLPTERRLLRIINRTIGKHALIRDGDRIAVAVSGGKDSLTLARLLHIRRAASKEKYDLIAIHVLYPDPAAEQRREHLQALMDTWGIPITFSRMEIPPGEDWPTSCHRCTWHRRRTLFQTAHALGYPKIALGHHQDDMFTTALMNMVQQGKFQAPALRLTLFDGAITLIRPLADVPEPDIRRYIRLLGVDIRQTSFDCPLAGTTERDAMKSILRELLKRSPAARTNIARALERCNEKDKRT